MHSTIKFPEEPKKPEEPQKENFKDRTKFEEEQRKYKIEQEKYKRDLINYKISLRLNPNSTFHYLFVVYKDGLKEPDYVSSPKKSTV